MAYDRMHPRDWSNDPRAFESLLGESEMGGNEESAQNLLDMLLGTGEQYAPREQPHPEMHDNQRMDPNQLIQQLLARGGR